MAFTTTTGAGGTSLIGTSGIDTASLTTTAFASNVYVAAEGANDNFSVAGGVGSATNYSVFGGAGNDTLNFAVLLSTSQVKAGEGDDVVNLNAVTSSTISGLEGIDTINLGGAIQGGALINGNDANDAITSTAALAVTGSSVVGGQGQDTITIRAGAGLTAVGSRINGQDGDDTLNITLAASMVSSSLNGGQGADTITFVGAAAGGINGVASGDLGNDTITGGTGNDTIFGGDGSDLIAGNAAATGDFAGDQLSGGAGVDTFGNGQAGNSAAVSTNANIVAAGSITAGQAIQFGLASIATGTGRAASSVDIITDFSAGAGGDFINTSANAAGALQLVRTNAIGSADGLGAIGNSANTVFGISGTWNANTGVFTVAAANGAGIDTLVVVNTATGLQSSTESFILQGVNSSSLVAANFV